MDIILLRSAALR